MVAVVAVVVVGMLEMGVVAAAVELHPDDSQMAKMGSKSNDAIAIAKSVCYCLIDFYH